MNSFEDIQASSNCIGLGLPKDRVFYPHKQRQSMHEPDYTDLTLKMVNEDESSISIGTYDGDNSISIRVEDQGQDALIIITTRQIEHLINLLKFAKSITQRAMPCLK